MMNGGILCLPFCLLFFFPPALTLAAQTSHHVLLPPPPLKSLLCQFAEVETEVEMVIPIRQQKKLKINCEVPNVTSSSSSSSRSRHPEAIWQLWVKERLGLPPCMPSLMAGTRKNLLGNGVSTPQRGSRLCDDTSCCMN